MNFLVTMYLNIGNNGSFSKRKKKKKKAFLATNIYISTQTLVTLLKWTKSDEGFALSFLTDFLSCNCNSLSFPVANICHPLSLSGKSMTFNGADNQSILWWQFKSVCYIIVYSFFGKDHKFSVCNHHQHRQKLNQINVGANQQQGKLRQKKFSFQMTSGIKNSYLRLFFFLC